jgi:uncharacterized protein YndB with AHSA1/START domain
MAKPTFVYVTYIATTLEKLWDALTSEAFMQQYWGDGPLQSDWQIGSPVQRVDAEGKPQRIGEVLQSEAPHQLSYSFQPSDTDVYAVQPSRVRFELEQSGEMVKLTLIHDRLTPQSCLNISHHWTTRLSYLKRLLELEEVLALVA